MNTPLSPDLLRKIDAYWRAANYLSVGQIYLRDNPLLRVPLALEHVKRQLLGHWGTTPGQNFIYAHLNRVIRERDLDMFYISGPGHGGPALVANTYLEGTYSEVYPHIAQDAEGLKRLFKQFSFPGGIPSHVSPECPGSLHEGGELGYSLSHAFGAVLDNPGLIPGYAPDATGDYIVLFVAQQTTGTDQQTTNDTLYQDFIVSDSTYARDNGDITGNLGIGAGNGGFLGQSFLLNADDTLTSVTASFVRGYSGRQAAIAIWSMLNGVPDQIIASTDTILYPSDDALDITIRIHGGAKPLAAGSYAVTAIEFDSTLALALTSARFTAHTTWVNWPTTPLGGWGHNEDFGASFAKSYSLRPNFGDVCSGLISTIVSTLPASCASCTDGSAWVDVSGDHGGLTYIWNTAATTDSIADLAVGTYTVVVTDMFGCMASDSGEVSFTTGLGAIGDLQGAMLYPNPNPGTFQVALGDVSGPVDLQLFDLRGKLVWSGRRPASGGSIISVDQPFASGAYTLHLISSQGRTTLPLVITAR